MRPNTDIIELHGKNIRGAVDEKLKNFQSSNSDPIPNAEVTYDELIGGEISGKAELHFPSKIVVKNGIETYEKSYSYYYEYSFNIYSASIEIKNTPKYRT
jgi:hypothetical protein